MKHTHIHTLRHTPPFLKYVYTNRNYVKIISIYVEITPNDLLTSKPHKEKEKGSANKPAHAHSRHFNIINNYVGIIVIMYFSSK